MREAGKRGRAGGQRVRHAEATVSSEHLKDGLVQQVRRCGYLTAPREELAVVPWVAHEGTLASHPADEPALFQFIVCGSDGIATHVEIECDRTLTWQSAAWLYGPAGEDGFEMENHSRNEAAGLVTG
jgi:hypothetical protein